ncbi:MAG: hypothetical protein HGA45_14745 [Chloroflexales bacterium]|nr:hypothetical protein [Chloroflexales bacterium]
MIWFYAEDIVAWLELDPNRAYVPVADLAARLELATPKEERRVRAHGLLSTGARRLEVETDEGDSLVRLCLRVELVPLWLMTVEPGEVADAAARARLELFQREAASALWQAFRPQGFDSGDIIVAPRQQQDHAEQAYVGAMAVAAMARQQLLIERQLNAPHDDDTGPGADPWAARASTADDPAAARVAQTVRKVARTLGERTRRNEYWGALSGLFRNFGISSYRRMPANRLYEALEWLERWYGDMMGEPEPPPDI